MFKDIDSVNFDTQEMGKGNIYDETFISSSLSCSLMVIVTVLKIVYVKVY